MTDANVALAGCDFHAAGDGPRHVGLGRHGHVGHERLRPQLQLRDDPRSLPDVGGRGHHVPRHRGDLWPRRERADHRPPARRGPRHRDGIVVATKFLPVPWKLAVSSALMAALRASLDRLRLPWVHLYQIHGPISLRSHQAMAAALAEAHRRRPREGRRRVELLGTGNAGHTRRARGARHRPWRPTRSSSRCCAPCPSRSGLLRACRELGVVVLATHPSAQGRLTGKYSAANPPPGRRGFSRLPDGGDRPARRRAPPRRRRYGGKTAGTGRAELGDLQRRGADSGAKNRRQAEQNAGALGWRLSAEDVRRSTGSANPAGARSCIACGSTAERRPDIGNRLRAVRQDTDAGLLAVFLLKRAHGLRDIAARGE